MNPSWSVSLFWLATALAVLVALGFVLPPLLRGGARTARAGRREVNIAVYRDQMREMEADRDQGLLSEEQFRQAKLELEARLAEDALLPADTRKSAPTGGRTLGYALGAALPATAFGLYFLLGNPAALAPAVAPPPQAGAAMSGHDIERMIKQAEAKVQANPEDGEAWAMLARSYVALGRWPEAWKAYQFAARAHPEDASLLSGQAEALAVLKGGELRGEPMKLVERALELDAKDPKALELTAAFAFQNREFARAADYLERLDVLVPAQDPFKEQLRAALNQSRQLARSGGLDNLSAAPAAPPPAAPAGPTIRGSIELAPSVAPHIGAGDTIFLFARAAGGGPPVAVVRGPALRFPMDFELSDRWAMNPDNPLSRQRRVMLVARISKSGAPMAQSGDLEGSVPDVPLGAGGVRLVIDRVTP